MKIEGKLICPHCGSKETHAWKYNSVGIWDDTHHEYMNEEFKELGILSCDSIEYSCKCRDCEKHFGVKMKLKCEVEEIKTCKNQNETKEIDFPRLD